MAKTILSQPPRDVRSGDEFWRQGGVALVVLAALVLAALGVADAGSLTPRGCDAQPLGNRRAVILIHGLASEASIWGRPGQADVCQHAAGGPDQSLHILVSHSTHGRSSDYEDAGRPASRSH